MTLDVHVASATFSDGTEVQLSSSSVTFVVGANNSGKSQLLRELRSWQAGEPIGPVLRSAARGGADGEAIAAWLEAEGLLRRDALNNYTFSSGITSVSVSTSGDPLDAVRRIGSGQPLGYMTAVLVQLLSAEERLHLTNAQPSYDRATAAPANALQHLQAEPALEAQLSDAALAAFGDRVTLNRVAGPHLHLHVGTPSRPPSLIDAQYAAEISALPRVEQQGDGYKSFLGLMLTVLVSRSRILLIDEPEAFLHPPQARRLGREIASRVQDGRQAFVATHSADVIEGALQSSADVSVLRITRDGTVNRPTVLASSELQELWKDPLLRYSGALDALFARGLVLCENERDCTFYLAVLDEDDDAPSDHDLEFAAVGGKGAIPRVATAIAALGVPVRAICDIDVLNSEALLERIVTSLGGTLEEEMRRDLRIVESAVVTMAETPSADALAESLSAVLSTNDGDQISRDTWNALQKLARKPSGWKQLKQAGTALLRGEQHDAATRLIEALREQGLYVVDKGELEGWVPDAGSKGPEWLPRAFERDGHKRPEVRAFVRTLTEF